MKKEPINPSPTMQSDCIQRLLKHAKTHIDRTDRRAQLGAFRLIWTPKEDNSIADIANHKKQLQ